MFQNAGNGLWYAAWIAHPGFVLTLAQLDNPWAVHGTAVVIPASCKEVREGPQLLSRDGKFFLVYSACNNGKPYLNDCRRDIENRFVVVA